MKNLFESGGTHIFDNNNLPSPHDITGLISLFFAQLPETFLPIIHVRGSFGVFTLEKCKEVISKLKPCNKETLFMLLKHFRLVLEHSKKNNCTKDVILKFLFPHDASYVIISNILHHYDELFKEKNDIEDKLNIIRQEFLKQQLSPSHNDQKKSFATNKVVMTTESFQKKVTKEDSDSKIDFSSIHSPMVSEVDDSSYSGSFHFQKEVDDFGSSLDELPDRFLSENALDKIKFSGLVDKNIDTESQFTSAETTPKILTPRGNSEEDIYTPNKLNIHKTASERQKKEENRFSIKKLSLDREINEKESDKLLSYLEKLKLNQNQKDEPEIIEKRHSYIHSPRIPRNLKELLEEEEEYQNSKKSPKRDEMIESPKNKLQIKKDIPQFEGYPSPNTDLKKLDKPIQRKSSLPVISKSDSSPQKLTLKQEPLKLNIEYPKYEVSQPIEAPKKRNFEKYQMEEPQTEVGSPKRPPSPIKLQVRVPTIDMSKLSTPISIKSPEKKEEEVHRNTPIPQKMNILEEKRNEMITKPQFNIKNESDSKNGSPVTLNFKIPVTYDPVDPEFKLPVSTSKTNSPQGETKTNSPEPKLNSPEAIPKEFEKYQNLLGGDSPKRGKRTGSPITIQMKLPETPKYNITKNEQNQESPILGKRSSSPVTIKLPEPKVNQSHSKPIEENLNLDSPKSEFELYQIHINNNDSQSKTEKRTVSPVTINIKVPNQPPKIVTNPKPISETNGINIQKPIPLFKITPKEEQNSNITKPIPLREPMDIQKFSNKDEQKLKQNFEPFESPKVNPGYFINIVKDDNTKKLNVQSNPPKTFNLNVPKLEIKK